MPKISVIVPVYKVEQYLDKCVSSITNQTYKNLEIILVNDGSPDSCPQMCDDWAKKDDRIKVIHKQNGGVASARNMGIDCATGDYISFVDSDDVVDLQLFEVLVANAQKHNADISCCQLKIINIDGSSDDLFSNPAQLFKPEDIIKNYFFDSFTKINMYSQCNKIFKSSLLSDLRYKNYGYGEDILFVFEAVCKANAVYYDDYVGYYYIRRENSAMTSTFSNKRLDYIFAIKEIEDMCKADYPFAYNSARVWVYQHILITVRQIIQHSKQKELCDFVTAQKRYLKSNKALLKHLPKKRVLDYLGVMYIPIYIKILTKLKSN